MVLWYQEVLCLYVTHSIPTVFCSISIYTWVSMALKGSDLTNVCTMNILFSECLLYHHFVPHSVMQVIPNFKDA